jgi:hypothetical protein
VRSRMKAILALSVAASLFAPVGDLAAPTFPNSTPVAEGTECGKYPNVRLKRDCWILKNKEIAKRWRAKPVAKCIRHYESGHNYRAVSPQGSFRGAYQFNQSTFDSVGPDRFDGLRANRAPRFLQDLKARRLYHERGLQPWPTPRQRCQ